jgi:hypothetical protein
MVVRTFKMMFELHYLQVVSWSRLKITLYILILDDYQQRVTG